MNDMDSQVRGWLNDSIDAQLGPRREAPPFDPNRSPRITTSPRRGLRHWALPLLAAACTVAVVTGTWAAVDRTSSRRQLPPATQGPAATSKPNTPSATPSRDLASATTTAPHPSRTASATRPGTSTSGSSAPAASDPAANAPWTAPTLLITPTALGAVRDGMTLAQAEHAAGMPFPEAGDGAYYPLLANGPHLYVRPIGSAPFPACRGAIGDGTGMPRVITAEGFRLGQPVTTLKAIYGNRLVYVPAPLTGMAPRAGYTLNQPDGTLIFGLDPTATTVTEIAGSSSPTLQPSGCPG